MWPTSRRTRVPRVQLPSVSCCTRSPRERSWSAWTSSCSMNRRGRASEFQPGPADAVWRWCCFSKTTVWCSATGQWDSRDRPRNDSRNNLDNPSPTPNNFFLFYETKLFPLSSLQVSPWCPGSWKSGSSPLGLVGSLARPWA